ncbi:MAG: phosphoenolpyruvate--protein phosphotransferase [Pseudonocardiales bacterium]|nr:MAG: phosphoenolpyruvate--protein phosphotransferase [Pseudonocardiales bacterium]
MSSQPAPVGIVVVSHSRCLADAAVALATEMVRGRDARIAVAAGLDAQTLGTDAVQIQQAIEQVDGPAGVVVLMDLGSAVLSAELAIDLLGDPTARDRVVLCPGPLVEGLVVAVVAASGGADRHEVAAEAASALMGKQSHLVPAGAGAGAGAGAAEPTEDEPAEVVGVFTVANAHGLHARPAARLVGEVRTLDAQVRLRNRTTGAGPVAASSLTKVATLGAQQGHQVEVSASGTQARRALEHVLALAARRFDEVDPPAPTAPDAAGVGGGRPAPACAQPASPGIAIGPVLAVRAAPPLVPDEAPATAAVEWRRLGEAVAAPRREVQRLRAAAVREVGETEAAIFDAHLMLLDDPDLLAEVRRGVDAGQGAPAAWDRAVVAVERDLAALSDPYLRARAADVRAVGDQVLRAMTGQPADAVQGEGILVARDLTPATAAGLRRDRIRGIVLALGSPTSHAAILARSRGIPTVVGAGPDALAIPAGTTLVVDGGTGEIVVDPAPAVLADYRERARRQERQAAEQLAAATRPARTRDDVDVLVSANLGSVADARAAQASGADAAGLVRTEFLFFNRDRAPDVDEQEAEYRAIAEAMGGRRITIRTLDAGGDKPVPYLRMPAEANPFLGVRGIRLTLKHPALLHDQLVAICRVARETPVSVLFPMVSGPRELLAARTALAAAAADAGGMPAGLEVGIMVEVPAAALKIESLLPHVDFLSVGTNDLTQYALAADRGNAAVGTLLDPLDPGVLALVDLVCCAARDRVPVAVCGEVAADETAIPLLLGLGVADLSVSPYAVPAIKSRVREFDLGACQLLARAALGLADADEVRAAITRWAGRCGLPGYSL